MTDGAIISGKGIFLLITSCRLGCVGRLTNGLIILGYDRFEIHPNLPGFFNQKFEKFLLIRNQHNTRKWCSNSPTSEVMCSYHGGF